MKTSFRPVTERPGNILHTAVALGALWLILTSPWVLLRRTIPNDPGFFDLAHIGIGVAMAPLAVVYFGINAVRDRWRQYFPWLAGDLGELGTDLKAIVRMKIPAAGGAGLFSILEGLLLVMLLVTAITGIGWLAADGARIALAWREWHIIAANGFAWVLVLHVIAVALHLLDFLRE